jgi:predicted AlkP superfamily pyrophosphatase or phosphodiesterase
MRLSILPRSVSARPLARAVLSTLVGAATVSAQPTAQPTAQSAAQPATAPPQLVVLITVDQLRPDYLTRWEGEFTGGLARLLRQGAFFTEAVHDHATTETAPGHATLGSGRHPRHTNIVRNEVGVGDPQAPLVDGARGGGASPWRFRGTALIDWMRSRDQWTRGLSVSRKDRGAILPMGRAQQSAYWYSTDGRFVTSTYYADTLPTWVRQFNGRDFVGALDGASWTLLREPALYPERDDIPRENGGRDFTFPHVLPAERARRASQLTEYPVMDSLTVQFALAGVEAMELGARTSTDFLGVSLSTTDAVGHRYGPQSREVHDQVLRVDRYLGQLIDSLYALRDSSRILFALSADHGVAPYPELYFTGADTTRGRVDIRPVFAAAHSALAARGIEGDALEFESGIVVLDSLRLRARGVPVDSVIQSLRRQLRALPGVMRVDEVAELAALAARGDPYAQRWWNAIPHDFGAVLTITLEPNHYWFTYRNAGHGMPHEYDMRVPIIFMGPAFVPGRYPVRARTVDLAPTLARALGVTPSEPIDGTPLTEAFTGDVRRGTPSPAVVAPAPATPRPRR